MAHYDYFVLGAGSGGVRSARIAASYGAKVGIAEKASLGGTCVNLGCVPKKIMVYAGSYGRHFEDAKGYGWNIEGISFDWNTLIKNKNERIKRINTFFENLLKDNNVALYRGLAHFIDENTLKVGEEEITADKFLVAVGGKPKPLNIPGAEYMALSDDFFYWEHPPKKAVIVGGGYIAIEFANILQGIGCDVTLLYYRDLFLRGFDHDLREKLAEQMKNSGINVYFNSNISKVEKTGENAYIIHTKEGLALECDLPISAVGRTPSTNNLGADKASIELNNKGQIIVDENYLSSNPKIYAVGDVTDTPQLTPVAIAEGHVLADRLFGNMLDRAVNYENLATVMFSEPPIGTIGLTEDQAKEKGIDFRVYKTSFTPMRNQLAGRDQPTFMKLIVDNKTERVIGLHMIGLDAPEMMQGFSVAMNAGATKADFDRTIPIHPTSAEEFVTMRKAVGEE